MARRVAAVAGSAVALVLWFSVTGWALTLNQGLTPNQLNTIEDQDRDSYIDVDDSGTFNVGDVLTGFVRFDDFLPENPPGGGPVNEQVYAVFSQQVTSIDTQLVGTNNAFATIGFGPTTTPGLTLADLTGDPSLDGVMFAVYDTAGSFGNLVETAPGTSMLDYIEFIATGDLRLGITLGPAPDYFTALIGTSAFPAGADLVNSGFSNAGFPSLPTSSQIGAFSGGLSVVVNNTIFDYAPAVVSSNLTLHQVAVSNGAIRGQVGDPNAAFFTPSGTGFPQCDVAGTDVSCGFVTDADFFVFPTQVPVPGSLMLLGLGLVSAVAAGWSRRRQRP